jgi:MFS family permease
MDNLGAIGGPLLALGLVALVGIRTSILLSAIRSSPPLGARDRQPIRLRVRPVLHGRLGRLLVAVAAFELGNVAATLLILRATDLVDTDHSHEMAVQIALGLYAAYNLAATLASIPGGRLGDRRGNLIVLALGVLCFAVAYAGLAFAGEEILLLALLFGTAGIGIGLVETAEHAAVATLAPATVRGSAFGLLAAVQSFGNLASSAVAGALWTLASPRVAFLYLAAWMCMSLAALAFARGDPAATLA